MDIFRNKENITISITDNVLRVRGQVQNISDYAIMREKVVNLMNEGKKELKIIFEESHAITSSVIGFLLKIAQKDKVNIHIVAKNEDLYLLFEILGLIDIFKVTKLE